MWSRLADALLLANELRLPCAVLGEAWRPLPLLREGASSGSRLQHLLRDLRSVTSGLQLLPVAVPTLHHWHNRMLPDARMTVVRF